MERRNRLNRIKLVAIFALIFGVSAAIPAVASAQKGIVGDLVKGVTDGLGLNGGGGTDGGAAPNDDAPDPGVGDRAGSPPNYTPPLHGSNPHGQGDVATVDLLPDNALPQPGGIDDGSTVTVGQSRGEQDANGNYHGRVVLLDENLVNLINVSVETNEGDPPNTGPLGPLQTALDALCTGAGLGAAGCVQVAAINSTTTGNGSQNSFTLASTALGPTLPVIGQVGVNTSTAGSEGNISDDGTCQTSYGESHVEDASVSVPLPVLPPTITATALEGESTSTACNNGTQSVDQSSSVVGLQGNNIAIPPLLTQACADGDPNADTDLPLLPLVTLVCNADDTNGSQTSSPYGVREALSVFLLVLAGTDPVLKVVAAGPESHAVAPAATTPPTTPPIIPGGAAGGGGGRGGGGTPGGGDGGPSGGPVTTVAQGDSGELAFTGSNLIWLAVIGGMLILGGVGLTRASTRRHSRATA